MRGLLMVECLYHQTTKGNKTQTRRSGGLEQVNGSPEVKKKGKIIKPAIVSNPDDWELGATILGNAQHLLDSHYPEQPYTYSKEFMPKGSGFIATVNGIGAITCTARYKVGEVLYLKEPYGEFKVRNATLYNYYFVACEGVKKAIKWKNKLFMPKAAARSFIKITGIRCERLLDIKGMDCIAEGCETTGLISKAYGKENAWFTTDSHLRDSFISLYKFANNVKEVPNLWVFCYEFEYLPNYKLQL